jgi:hypothetical protein
MKWYPGTIIELTIGSETNPSTNGHGPLVAPTISSGVVRVDAEGIGVEFLYDNHQQRRSLERFHEKMPAANVEAVENPADPSAGGV